MPLSKCLHPVRVKTNKGDYQYVPCGKCEACRSLQAFTWKKRLDAEVQSNHWTLMFTLTYDENHLPFVFVDTNGKVEYHHLESHPTMSVSSDVLKDLDKYYKLINNRDGKLPYYKVPVICHYDVQDFIKRLKFYAPKIRWFISSEIGPTTLRSHYHGLLFFNEYDPEIVKTYIYKAWSKCDWSLPENQESIHLTTKTSYCTSYVACVQSLPLIHSFERFAQFRYTSNRPPIGSFVYSQSNISAYERAEIDAVPLAASDNKE